MSTAQRTAGAIVAAAVMGGLLTVAAPAGAAPTAATTPGAATASPTEQPRAGVDAPLLRSTDPAAKRFRAVGRLVNNDGIHCTASVVAGEGQVRPDARALVVTNGHCVSQDLTTNEVRVDQPTGQEGSGWRFTPAYFVDTVAQHRAFPVRSVRYATMKVVDVAVIELDTTYGELGKIDVRPLRLDGRAPAAGEAVEVAHAPVNDIPEDQQFLRHSRCRAGAAANVAEGPWLWTGAISNDCAGIVGGSSGSPVVRAGADRVVALTNTTVEPGYLGECLLGRPCEAGKDGVVARKGTSYAIPVGVLGGCLAGSEFTPKSPRCALDPGQPLVVNQQRPVTQSRVPQADGGSGPVRWQAALTGNGARYAQVKVGPFGTTDCTDPAGYGSVFALADRPVFDDLVPKGENLYVLCAVGGPSPTVGRGWQPHRFASLTSVRVDDTPPTVAPVVDAWESDDSWVVNPIFQPWEITGYEIKYGPRATTDCADPAGYRTYLRIPAFLKKSGAPWRYCAIGLDHADNRTPPKAFDIG
ncbi:trypsin-like serine peptidase [Streptoalloteichus hindustanus]|uniref:Trypsin-like peptidase domain-containing protein n=1 Tax=Streptoalloteichus hindustanus TaxID=2017 RepID=A0A1M4ULJ5_STRHI|nr:trypsin-like peptidase domain-containing protein [Streptoalloteichus hindustanus]SHE57453.1 Trypsin-like peptidase domain-containing protein [Streptoalloteichus hindustanus]